MLAGYYCAVGGHTVAYEGVDPTTIPDGWSWIRASVIRCSSEHDTAFDPGIWYEDQGSDVEVLCCPKHDIIRINK